MSQLRRISRRGEVRWSPPQRGAAPALDSCCPALHAATAASRRLPYVSLSPSPLSPPLPAPLSAGPAAAPSPTSPSGHAGVSAPRSPRDSGRPQGSHEPPRAPAAHNSSASSAHPPANAKRMTPESPTTTTTPLPPPTSGLLPQRPKRTLTLLGPGPGFTSLEEEARSTYTDVTENDYRYGANGYMATVTSYPCDCKPGLEGERCGERCFNRQLYIECVDCPCGTLCMNRRFQRKEWANVKLVKTKEKGFGLVAGADLKSGQFVMEYVGEVLPQRHFLQRAEKYAQSGLPHFYFMHLKKDEVIDATRRGCLARFINHSCNPNCTLQKWVVGNQTRMGFFMKRDVTAGEELTFDYKLERYGTKAQICHCGEDNCTGYIGGTKDEMSEVDQIDEEINAEVDERRDARIPQIVTKSFALADIPKCVQLMHRIRAPQWALVLLKSLNLTTCSKAINHFRYLKGLPLLHSWLKIYKDNTQMIKEILHFLPKVNVLDRRTVQDEENEENVGIEFTVEKLVDHEVPEISALAKNILESWTQLSRAERIPKKRKSLAGEDGDDVGAEPSKRHEPDLPLWALEAQEVEERRRREEEYARRRIAEENDEARRIVAAQLRQANEERRRREAEEARRRDAVAQALRECQEAEEERRRREEQKRQEMLAEESKQRQLEVLRATDVEARRRLMAEEAQMIANKHTARSPRRHSSSGRHQHHPYLNGKHKHHHGGSHHGSSGSASKHRGSTDKSAQVDVIKVDGSDAHRLKKVIAETVIKIMSRYTDEMQTTERFKRHASECTKALVEKEIRNNRPVVEFNDDKRKKIKTFVKEYSEKAVARLKQRNEAQATEGADDRLDETAELASAESPGKSTAEVEV